MTAEYAHTADGTTISLVDFPPPQAARDPIALLEGRFVYIPKAPNGTPLGPQPDPRWDIYRLTRDKSAVPIGLRQYYQTPLTATYTFRNAADNGPGIIGDGTSQVIEAIDWVASRKDIAVLYDEKVLELAQHAQIVENQGRTVTGLSDGDKDMPTSDDRRTFYVSLSIESNLPATTQFKFADLWGVFFPLQKADAQICNDQIVTFHDAPRFANADSLNNTMIGHRDANEWQQLAEVDVKQGWPAAPVDPRTKSAGAMRSTSRWDS